MLLSSSSQTQLLYVLWAALQLLVVCSLIGTTSEAGSKIPEFDNPSQNISAINEDSNRNIYLLTLLPYPAGLSSSNDGSNSLQSGLGREMRPALLSAAELAVNHINQDPYTLPGYRVELMNAESGCNLTTTALISFTKHVFHSEHKGRLITGIIGPTCSEPAIAISSIISRGGQLPLPNVHIASAAELEDRDKYPYSFGIVGSMFQIVDAVVSLIHYNGWKEVAIFYDESRASDALYINHRLREETRSDSSGNRGLSILHFPINDKFYPLETLTEDNSGIGIVMSTLALAQKLMCIAYHEGLIYPDYQWIIAEYSHSEFTENTNTTVYYKGRLYECFWSTQAGITLDHVVFIHFRLSEEDTSLRLISGYTYTDIAKQYERKFVYHNKNDYYSFPAVPNFIQAATTYDAVWALVLAMNMTVSEKSSDLNKLFPNVNFRGASGHITFDRNTGFVQRVVEIDQIHDGIVIPAGSAFQGNISFSVDPRIKYITTSQPRYALVNPVLAAFFMLVEAIMILSTAVIHIVTLLNRKYPSIKASSLGLNQFVFLACYIWGAVVITYALVKALGLPDFVFIGNACHALLVWLIPIALTLSFGTLIAKTWRIYRIFIHFRQPGPLLTNKALTVMVLIQLSIDVVIATAWTIVSPIMLIAIEEESYMNENGETIIPRMCVYTNTAIWLTMTIGYKFLQVMALLVLCIMTRNITNRNFSTTSLKVASYLCLLAIAIPGSIYGVLWYTNAEIHADFVVLCVLFCAIGFILCVLVLLPPALPLFVRYRHLCHR